VGIVVLRSLAVAKLYADTHDNVLVQSWLDAGASSIEQSSCSDQSTHRTTKQIKIFFFHRARRILFLKRMGGAKPVPLRAQRKEIIYGIHPIHLERP
jgi:hypothetical protein